MDMVQMLDGYGCNGNGRLTNRTGTGWVRNRFLRVGFKGQNHFSWIATVQGTSSVCHRDGVAGMATGTNLLTQPTHHGPFYDGFASLFLGTFQATL
jgi:hypothetical protein